MILNFNDGSLDMSQYSYPFTLINALGDNCDPDSKNATWLVDTETGECRAFSKDERGCFIDNGQGELVSHAVQYTAPLRVYDGNGKLVVIPLTLVAMDPVTLCRLWDGKSLRQLIVEKATRAVSEKIEADILGDDLPQPDAILQTKETP